MNNLLKRIRRIATACLLTASTCLFVGTTVVARAAGYADSGSALSYTHYLLSAKGGDDKAKSIATAVIVIFVAIVIGLVLNSLRFIKSTGTEKRRDNPPEEVKPKRKLPQFLGEPSENKTRSASPKSGTQHTDEPAKTDAKRTDEPTTVETAAHEETHRAQAQHSTVSLGSSQEIERLKRMIEILEGDKRALWSENERLIAKIDTLQTEKRSDVAMRAEIAKSYNSQSEALKSTQRRLAEIEARLKEREDVEDAHTMIKNAIIPFAANMLLNIHLSEDDGRDDVFVQTMKYDIEELLLRSVNVSGIKILYSEARGQGKPFDTGTAEIYPRYTDDREKDGTLYRTLCPGLIYKGKHLLYEKVEIFRYRESVQ